jgi:hypothetical protein
MNSALGNGGGGRSGGIGSGTGKTGGGQGERAGFCILLLRGGDFSTRRPRRDAGSFRCPLSCRKRSTGCAVEDFREVPIADKCRHLD